MPKRYAQAQDIAGNNRNIVLKKCSRAAVPLASNLL